MHVSVVVIPVGLMNETPTWRHSIISLLLNGRVRSALLHFLLTTAMPRSGESSPPHAPEGSQTHAPPAFAEPPEAHMVGQQFPAPSLPSTRPTALSAPSCSSFSYKTIPVKPTLKVGYWFTGDNVWRVMQSPTPAWRAALRDGATWWPWLLLFTVYALGRGHSPAQFCTAFFILSQVPCPRHLDKQSRGEFLQSPL